MKPVILILRMLCTKVTKILAKLQNAFTYHTVPEKIRDARFDLTELSTQNRCGIEFRSPEVLRLRIELHSQFSGNSSKSKSLSRTLLWLPVDNSRSHHSQQQLFEVPLKKPLIVARPVELGVPLSAPE
ncbi:hypothetical protein Nepgr_000435 [Nepenthes gracilis]|uniref:Uncharacterized protein n=1 Tax=Nepenthes gracilis TaxID=150966 RepID=A0AAD3RWG1_NEPGR|nr:hypothetical protein Nepgr_000435 [Nepenthes gracilis]